VEIGWKLRVQIAADVARAMAFLHSKKIMHRDLKSKNLLVDANWKIKRTHTTNQLTTIVAITTITTIAAVISLSTRTSHTHVRPSFFSPLLSASLRFWLRSYLHEGQATLHSVRYRGLDGTPQPQPNNKKRKNK
jgi:serine/threonine protein kinase